MSHKQSKCGGSICERWKENENLEGYPAPDCKECDGTGRTKWINKTDPDNNTLIGIEGAIPEIIAELPEYNPNSEANAKRIVQMNNSFDGLLEACRLTVKILESIPNIASLLSAQENIDLYTALDKSGQAIAQAEE